MSTPGVAAGRLDAVDRNENNLSETAFFVPARGHFELRWFTPSSEVDLCGHATLASAHVLFRHMNWDQPEVAFQTRSGRLSARMQGDLLLIDHLRGHQYACGTTPASPRRSVSSAARAVALPRLLPAVFDSEASVRSLRPDMAALARLPEWGIIATAQGNGCDFVSRFAPAKGIRKIR